MISRIRTLRAAACCALLLIPLILSLAIEPRDAAAQDPDPGDPFEGVPLVWYATLSPDGLYHPGDFNVTGTLDTTGFNGFWQLQPDLPALAAWLNGLGVNQQNVRYGIFVSEMARDPGTWVHPVAGIWQPDNDPWSNDPQQTFRYLDVRFFEDSDESHYYEPGVDLNLGDDETDLQGDALCPSGPCPHQFANLSEPGKTLPIGLNYKFRMELMIDQCAGTGYAFRLITAQGIPDVYGRNSNAYECLTALEGQVWNCLADSDCQAYGQD